MRYQLRFFDRDDAQVVRISGVGVVFRTRNFEGWREDTKEKFKKPNTSDFIYASAEAVGVETQRERFLAPLRRDDGIRTTGLITKENGLRPAHPHIGGSGDHVNSTHMGEVGRQFVTLLVGEKLINCGGDMSFLHYVELGRPFEVELLAYSEPDCAISMLVRQQDRDCTKIDMQFEPAQHTASSTASS